MKISLTSFFAVLIAMSGMAYGWQDKPKVIRLHVITVQMAQEDYIQYSSEKGAEYKRVQEYIAQQKAKVLDVNCLTMRSGEKGTLESIREYIYPTEYEPSSFTPQKADQEKRVQFYVPPRLRPPVPPAFETRNLGVTLEMEPTLGETGKIIDLRFSPEFIDHVGYSEWVSFKDEWGRADLKYPTFLTHRVNTGHTLMNGRFAITTTFSGKKGNGEIDPSRKILLFVMAEVIKLPDPM